MLSYSIYEKLDKSCQNQKKESVYLKESFNFTKFIFYCNNNNHFCEFNL